MSKTITLELCAKGMPEDIVYEGRCLGMLTNRLFAILKKYPKKRSGVYTSKTVSLAEIIDLPDVDDLRLCMTLTKKDGKPILDKKLLITERLEWMPQIYQDPNTGKDCINLTGKNDGFILITEDES